jgi:S1-C subfamily serine protease
MFQEACKKIRESLYGVIGTSVTAASMPNQVNISATNATAFMIAPGYLITAAHFVHQENNITKPIHEYFESIRAPEIGQKTEKTVFQKEDPINDIAILKIENPKNTSIVDLTKEIISSGTNCGFLGFPLATVKFAPNGQKNFTLFERFQGAYISNYMPPTEGRALYEIDRLMYKGSSGCPIFTDNAKVLGMQVMVEQQSNSNGQIESIDISLAVPSTEILKFWESYKATIKPISNIV